MGRARILAVAALLLGACTSTETRLERTWQRFDELRVTVLARWETLPVDETQRQALAMPDQNPVAHVARITALSSLAYLQGDLPTLQRALDCLVACDAEVAALAK